MRFFDQALEDFKTALARDGLLDDSVLVVFGDHDAGFARDAALARTIGIGADDAGVGAERSRFRCSSGRAVPGEAATAIWPACARCRPGRPISRRRCSRCSASIRRRCRTSGRNLLGAAADRPVPRPYGDWLDASHLFLARRRRRVLLRHRPPRSSARRRRARPQDALARRARDLSRLVVVDDLQQQLRARLAADPNDEYNAPRPHARLRRRRLVVVLASLAASGLRAGSAAADPVGRRRPARARSRDFRPTMPQLADSRGMSARRSCRAPAWACRSACTCIRCTRAS